MSQCPDTPSEAETLQLLGKNDLIQCPGMTGSWRANVFTRLFIFQFHVIPGSTTMFEMWILGICRFAREGLFVLGFR